MKIKQKGFHTCHEEKPDRRTDKNKSKKPFIPHKKRKTVMNYTIFKL